MITREIAVADLQRMVHECIVSVGGYWSPLSAVARLLEELGEFMSELQRDPRIGETMVSELADLFIVSTCLANQYCVSLAAEYELLWTTQLTAPSADRSRVGLEPNAVFRLVSEAGAIARLINFYDGEKNPKELESLSRVGPLVAQFHQSLFTLAWDCELDLVQAVSTTTARSVTRDNGRFQIHFDPITSASLVGFRAIRCKFPDLPEPLERLWGAPDWNPRESLLANLSRVLPSLRRFAKIAGHEGLHGFVIEVKSGTVGTRGRTPSALIPDILEFISTEERTEHSAMSVDPRINRWQILYGGIHYLVDGLIPSVPDKGRPLARPPSTFLLIRPAIYVNKSSP